jgi:hypothetical protein
MVDSRTSTTLFMVPTLGVPNGWLDAYGFIEAYSFDPDREEQYKNSIYLLFKPKNMSKFEHFLESEQKRTRRLIDDYDLDGGYVVLVYTLNGAYIEDFDLIKAGRYSETSKEFREFFPKFIKTGERRPSEVESLQHMIFRRDPFLRKYLEKNIGFELVKEVEVWQGFDIERETLKL